MTKQKELFPNFLKIVHASVSLNQNNTLLHPFVWTVTVSITFWHGNIKYWKNNSKKHSIKIENIEK